VLDQIVQTGHVVRGWIGADYGVLPISADSGLPSAARGVVVNDVSPGGPAAIAGIQQRDVLLKIGGEDILDPSDLRRREASFKPGTAIEVSGLRSGAPFTSTITPSQRPPTAPMQALQGAPR